MKADRSLVGIIMIALVVSTVITLFIIGEGGGPYSIIKSEYSKSGTGRWLIGVNLLAKEPIGSLKISHYALIKRDYPEIDPTGTPEEVSKRIRSLESYMKAVEAVGGEPIVKKLRVQIPRWEDEDTLLNEEFDLYIYDFSEYVWQAVPDDIMYSLQRPRHRYGHLFDYYNAFGCAFDDNGNLTYFLEGVADFYVNKVIIIDELTVQLNQNKTTYYGVTKEDTPGGELSVLFAPDRGIVTFEDLERNDRISVVFSMDTSKFPLDKNGLGQVSIQSVLHIVEITVDDTETEYIHRIVEPNPPQPIT
jgi:hypothetical protein